MSRLRPSLSMDVTNDSKGSILVSNLQDSYCFLFPILLRLRIAGSFEMKIFLPLLFELDLLLEDVSYSQAMFLGWGLMGRFEMTLVLAGFIPA